MAQVIGNEVAESQVAESQEVESQDAETPAEETPKESTKRDPLAKYNELSAEKQETVDSIVADVIAKVGGDDIDLPMLLGILDKLNAEKKSAREVEKQKEKERKAAATDAQKILGKKIADKKLVKEGDKLDYFMSTTKVTILQATVIKVTDKSARIEVTADSLVLFKGKEMKAGEVAGLKLGKKSVPFGKIQNLTRNNTAISFDDAEEVVA